MEFMNSDDFELLLRKTADDKFKRPVEPGNPVYRLLQKKLPIEECREMYSTMWPSLMVFNRVLLTQLIEKTPTVEMRCELMEVINPEFGRRLSDAHPIYFKNFLEALGTPAALPKDFNLDSALVKDEVTLMRQATFHELLARLLVGESVGPKVFEAVGDALHESYNIPLKSLAYFYVHSKHDKRDTEVIFGVLSRATKTAAEQKSIIDMMNYSYDRGRYKLYGCDLPGKSNYNYADLFTAKRRSA